MKKIVLIPVLLFFFLLACSSKDEPYTESVVVEDAVVDENTQSVFKNVYFKPEYWQVDTTRVEEGAYKITLTPAYSDTDIDAMVVVYIHDEILDVPTYMKSLKRQVSGRKSLNEYAIFADVMKTQTEDGIEISESMFPISKDENTTQYKGYIRVYSDKTNRRTYGLFVVGRYYNMDDDLSKKIVNSLSFGKPKAIEPIPLPNS